MKHWTLRVLICLALGAVTTVGVAWVVVVAVDPLFVQVRSAHCRKDGETFLAQWHDSRGSSLLIFWRVRTPSFADDANWPKVREMMPAWFGAKPSERYEDGMAEFDVHYADARGLPARALWSERLRVRVSNKNYWITRHGVVTPGEVRYNGLWKHAQILPLHPIWPGFLTDTLFYGALWFALYFGFVATRAARRALRKKPGHCPKCAYDLRGNLDAGCPECGWNREEREA